MLANSDGLTAPLAERIRRRHHLSEFRDPIPTTLLTLKPISGVARAVIVDCYWHCTRAPPMQTGCSRRSWAEGCTALPESRAGASSTRGIGGSAGLWTKGIFRVEGDFSYSSRGSSRNPTIRPGCSRTATQLVIMGEPVSVTHGNCVHISSADSGGCMRPSMR